MIVESRTSVALRPRSAFTVAVILIAAAAVPTPFLAFVEDVSPLSVVQEAIAVSFGWKDGFFNIGGFVWIAAPFFLALFIAIAQVRWVANGRLSRGERLVAWVVGALSAASVAWFFWHDLWPETDDGSVAEIGLFLLLSLPPAGGLAVAAWLRSRVPAALAGLIAMETVYLSNACVCLWMFREGRYQAGAYCAAVAAAALLAHVVCVCLAGIRGGPLEPDPSASAREA